MNRTLVLLAVLSLASAGASAACTPVLNETLAERLASYALTCIDQEYPTVIHHTMQSPSDVGTPSSMTPAFYGCYDWHSAVHNHWLLVRLVRLFPSAPFAASARASLASHLSASNLEAEFAYVTADGRGGFERPYGLAWLLLLSEEVSAILEEDPLDADALTWHSALAPLAGESRDRMLAWSQSLQYPVRAGEHSQSAFSFTLALQYARRAADAELTEALMDAANELHAADADCPLVHYEPSGQDFLSPCLGAAHLMSRALDSSIAAAALDFSTWLSLSLPSIPVSGNGSDWLSPVGSTNPEDGKGAHLNGLNLSRAWMLDGIVQALSEDDPRRSVLAAVAEAHRERGIKAVENDMTYMESHWLPSFAVYATTCKATEI